MDTGLYRKFMIFVMVFFCYSIGFTGLSSAERLLGSRDDIALIQFRLKDRPIGERIAFWASRFIGSPYDTDPLGEYVRREVIIADDRVDCMYMTFRSVELALASTPDEAVNEALKRRFFGKGLLRDGRVLNYDDRYQYGEDMIDSGKWGIEITARLGKTTDIQGSRGRGKVAIISKSHLLKDETLSKIKNGDIVFFIKSPLKRIVDEIVGHIGIIEVKKGRIYLIHASGTKGANAPPGMVKRISFIDYIKKMDFVGIKVTRFE